MTDAPETQPKAKKRGCLVKTLIGFGAVFILLALFYVWAAHVQPRLFPTEEQIFLDRLYAAAHSQQNGETLQDLTPFEWETVCMFGPYSGQTRFDDHRLKEASVLFFFNTKNEEFYITLNSNKLSIDSDVMGCYGNQTTTNFYWAALKGDLKSRRLRLKGDERMDMKLK